MKKMRLLLQIIYLCIFITSCTSSQWQTSKMETSSEKTIPTWDKYDGEIPLELKKWDVIADISSTWSACDYAFNLRYTTLSIDNENRIWIYGPDQWIGQNVEIVPDAPKCDEDLHPLIIRYDQNSQQAETVRVNLENGSFISSARGWSHLGNGKVLLSSVFIYHGPWDAPDGGAGNKYIDLAILENGNIRELLGGSTSLFSIPDYAISNNIVFAISNTPTFHGIKILDLSTEKLVGSISPPDCENIAHIEISDNNIFLICKSGTSSYLRVYTKEMGEIISWLLNGDTSDFPLAVDSSGSVWVGDSYVATPSGITWTLDGILPERNFYVQNGYDFYKRKVFAMMPYENKMLISLEGAIYLADYRNKQWEFITYQSPPLPIAIGADGKIYVFTGKYIIATKP